MRGKSETKKIDSSAIRSLIKVKKLTIRKVAEMLGVHETTFYGWLKNERIPVSAWIALDNLLSLDKENKMVPINKYTLIFKQETVDKEGNIKNIEEPLIMHYAYDKFDDPNNKYLIFSLLVKEMSKYFDREICEKIFLNNQEKSDELSKLQK